MYRLKALSSALAFNVRTAPPARLLHSSPFSTSSYLAKMLSTGSCYCRAITYEVSLNSADDARTSICHCKNCKACTPPASLSHVHLQLSIALVITHSITEVHRLQLWHYVQDPKVSLQDQVWRTTRQNT